MKLSVKISILIGIVVLMTVISITVLIEIVMRKQIEAQYLEKLTISVYTSSKLIRTSLDAELSKLWEIANRIQTRSFDWYGVTRASLLPDVSRLGSMDLGLVHPDGFVQYVSDESTANLGDRDYIKRALSGQSNVSDVIISRVTNSLVLMFAVPIYQHSYPGAPILGAMIERRNGSVALRNLVIDSQDIEGAHSFMINKQGTYVAHADESLVFQQINPIQESLKNPEYESIASVINDAVSRFSGNGRFTENGKSYLAAYQEIPDTNWIVFSVLDEDIIKASLLSLRNTIIINGLICLLLATFVSILVGKRIARPIIQLRNVVKKIYTFSDSHNSVGEHHTEYDLTQTISVSSKDEIGELANDFNQLIQALKNPMCDIRDVINSSIVVTKELVSISSQLENGSNQTVLQSNEISNITKNMVYNISSVAASSEQVSSSAKEVTNSAGQMSSRMETVVTAMDEMTRSITKIADNTSKVNKVTEEANIKSQEVSEVMSNLEVTASEIGEVTQTIKSIANKTNLLALNASVEAARAGDAGKGFAVVADEVKALANQAAISADNIDKKISDIQSEILRASTTFQGVSNIIHEINENIDSISKFIQLQANASNTMSHNVTDTNTGTKTVASAISEVAKSSHLIAKNANDISKGTDEVNENMIVMSQNAKLGVEGAVIVSEFSSKLQDISSELKVAIGKFELGCTKCNKKTCVSSIKSLQSLTSKSKEWRNK